MYTMKYTATNSEILNRDTPSLQPKIQVLTREPNHLERLIDSL